MKAIEDPAPSTSTELVHVPREKRAPTAVAKTVAATPPAPRRKPASRRIAKRTRRRSARKEPRLSPLARHQAHCGICSHESREAIEEEFISWNNVYVTATNFGINYRALYRHAHATGLFPIRDRNLRRALGHIIHRTDRIDVVTADSAVRAVRTLAHINEAGQWVTPAAHVIVSSGAALQATRTAPPARKLSVTQCRARNRLKP